jgi:transcriptional regulator with XRE-family HTH domain
MPIPWPEMRAEFKRWRKQQRLTQKDVEKRGGVDQSSISKIESDEAYTPLVDTFCDAVHGLGISVTEFFACIERLPIVREGGKTTVHLPAHEKGSRLSSDATTELQTLALALIDALQDVVGTHDARRRRPRSPRPADRRAAGHPPTESR